MKLFLDTQILVWAALGILPDTAVRYIAAPDNVLLFSPASIWEIVIKKGLGRPDFDIDPLALYRGCLNNGYICIDISADHVLAVGRLLPIHKDPFDRLLIAQTQAESAALLTADEMVARYPGNIIHIRR